VARGTRVCVYDRPGRGWSDPAAIPPDGAQVATDLRTLLDRAGVPGPYVLAGHSFGGLYVQAFAAQYPGQVAGLVLVDSTAPSSAPMPPPPSDSYSVVKRVSALLSTTALLGVPRLLTGLSSSDLPPRSEAESQASAVRPEEVASVVDEYAVAGRSTRAAGRLSSLDGRPLVVLTADLGTAPGWTADQDAMARLSANSRHFVVDGSTHASLVEDPEHAAEVSQAILDVVESVRTATPLP
jgi:pimeloyl-ACP methyl ester carboxylesterase